MSETNKNEWGVSEADHEAWVEMQRKAREQASSTESHMCECGYTYTDKFHFHKPPGADERRRYALLQAAATICGHTITALSGVPEANAAMWVGIAEELLAEI